MKIAYFLDIAHGLGGAGNVLLERAYLMSALHNVIVVVPCDEMGVGNGEYIRRCQNRNLKYEVLPYVTSWNFREVNVLAAEKNRRVISDFAKSEQIELFHSVQLNVTVEDVARQLQIPHVMDIYQLADWEFMTKQGDIYPCYVISDSLKYAKVWRRQLDAQTWCVRPTAPLETQQSQNTHEIKKWKFLMLGAVCGWKNQLAALGAIHCLHNDYDVYLTIAGDKNGTYGKKCQSYITEHHMEAYVEMTGFVKDIRPLLRQNDCILCTSIVESFPSSLVEALTYGLTVVTTPVAGVPELFRNQYNCFMSRGFEADEIYESMKACIEAYKSGAIKGVYENAAKTWQENFAPAIIQGQLGEIYAYVKEDALKKRSYSKLDDMVNKAIRMRQHLGESTDHLLYYAYIDKMIPHSGRILLWGAGKNGKRAYELINRLWHDGNILAFIDTNGEGTYCGLDIIRPDMIGKYAPDVIFICFASGREEVISYLEQVGYQMNRNVFILP